MTARVAKINEREATVVVRGVAVSRLRAAALRECAERFGGTDWQVEREEIAPCVVTPGGRVRLYEARIVAGRS